MTCSFSGEQLEAVRGFHGHSCPGLAIGIRAAEYALREFAGIDDGNLVCVSETDMCGVDGIQYLTGCTFGKGNFIHRDVGKAAFSFFDRGSGKALRFLLRTDAKDGKNAPAADRQEMITLLMDKPLEEVFTCTPLDEQPPKRARILSSLVCEQCHEETMESRTRRYQGQTLCIPCFTEVEQKL